MNILTQPTPTTCGQTCVAMLAGVDVEEVCIAIGHGGPTRTRHLVDGLRAFGLRCGPKLLPLRHVRGLSTLAIVKVAPPKGRGGWHWVVWADGRYFDPQVGRAYEADDFTDLARSLGWRVTSLLPVSPP